MAKIKNKNKKSSDVINAQKVKLKKKQLNPFEIHINKEKLKILGKKQVNNKGLPGVSRAKAIQKRKGTLLQEYNSQNRTNKFNDKRIGEKNHTMSEEDKTMARFTAVRIKAHGKKSIFNLADDEILTHGGQTLSEIEKFDDPRSDDESLDEDSKGKLNDDFVDAHFGGGLLQKTNRLGSQSHKDVIEQLILDSKKRKAEQQKVKEATLELTQQLDTEWKDLIPLVSQTKNKDDTPNKFDVDDYDKLMKELRFDARGTVSDRLKTEDEIAKEEKERLEKLEQERLLRMKGVVEENKAQTTHRSADDIDDNIVYEEVNDYTLSYDGEGKSTVKVDKSYVTESGVVVQEESDVDESDIENTEVDDEGGAEKEISEEGSNEDNLSDFKNDSSGDDSDGENVDNGEEAEKEICKEGSDEDNLSDLKNDSSGDDSVGENVINHSGIKEIENQSQTSDDHNKVYNATEKIREDLLKRKLIMEQAMKELPFTFSLPETYESLQKILENQSSIHQSVIIERMMKCNHPSLAVGNKDKLGLLFAYLLQYLNDRFEDCSDESYLIESFYIFEAICPRMYELAQISPEHVFQSLLEVIKEKHSDYKRQPTKYPDLELLIFLKLVGILLPTSDYRHQIVTPCFLFMEQLLNRCKIKCKRDISYGFFIVTLILEFTAISKRFLPAAIKFLSGILHMAIPKIGVKIVKVLPPFKAISCLLVLLENFSSAENKNVKMNFSDLLNAEIEEKFKIKVLFVTIKLLNEFHAHLQTLPSCVEIFSTVLAYLKAIPMDNYPKLVRDAHAGLVNILNESKEHRKTAYLVMQAMKPKALRMLEPKIEEIFDRKRTKFQSREKAERDKLIHKLKKERKGALREIRRDKDFLGRVKVQQRIRSDKERRDKVKRIYAEAASQQSELNAIDRKKKRKK